MTPMTEITSLELQALSVLISASTFDLLCSARHRATDRDDCAAFSAARNGAATFESRRGSHSPAPREPASRETPPAACNADNPAIRPSRMSNSAARLEPLLLLNALAVNDSCCAEAALPSAPGTNRVIVSTIIAAPNSPPLSTKSPTEISRSARCSLTRSSTPS